jgi:hypothetical protein
VIARSKSAIRILQSAIKKAGHRTAAPEAVERVLTRFLERDRNHSLSCSTARERTASTSLPVDPALRAMAPREHHQASQASGRSDSTARANRSGSVITRFQQVLSVVRINDLLLSQFDASPSPRCSLLTESPASAMFNLRPRLSVDKLPLHLKSCRNAGSPTNLQNERKQKCVYAVL